MLHHRLWMLPQWYLCLSFFGTYFGCGTGGRGEARGGLGTRWLWRRGAEGSRVPGQDLHTPRDDGVWDLRTHKARSAQSANVEQWWCLPSSGMPKGDDSEDQGRAALWDDESETKTWGWGCGGWWCNEDSYQSLTGQWRWGVALRGRHPCCRTELDKVGKDDGGAETVDYTGQMHTVMDFFFLIIITSLLCFINILTALLLPLITDIPTDLHLILP